MLRHPDREKNELFFMERAVALGEKGRRTSAPNPWVGCVVVNNGELVAEGYHAFAGEPHAEVHALKEAGERARGSTVYTTLEPCAHYGKTPPCVDALIEGQVSRVVTALEDPDSRVAGRGFHRLLEAGIRVDVGIGREAARASLTPYLHHRSTKLPYCILKAAISADGRTAAADGTSQWITGEKARADVHCLRAESQAVLIGAGTAVQDSPSLTVRHIPHPADKQPLRVLLDGRASVPPTGPLADTTLAPTLLLSTDKADAKMLDAWETAGAEVYLLPSSPDGEGVDLHEVLKTLGQRGILQVLIEGGGMLHGGFYRGGLVNQLTLYIGACALGSEGFPLFAGIGPQTMNDARRWTLAEVQRFGDDVRLDYLPNGG